jgi:hypothetical protein
VLFKTNEDKGRFHHRKALQFGEGRHVFVRAFIVQALSAGVDRAAITAFIAKCNETEERQVAEAAGVLAGQGRIDDALLVARAAPRLESKVDALAAIGNEVKDSKLTFAILQEADELLSMPDHASQSHERPGGLPVPPMYYPLSLIRAYIAAEHVLDAFRVSTRFESRLDRDQVESVARALMYRGYPHEARVWINAKARGASEHAALLQLLANSALEANNREEARLALDEATKIASSSFTVDTASELATAWAALNNPNKGAEIIRAALQATPTKSDLSSVGKLVRTLAAIGFEDDAVSLTSRRFGLSHVVEMVISELSSQGQFTRALQTAAKYGGSTTPIYVAMAEHAVRSGDSQAVINALTYLNGDTFMRSANAEHAVKRLVQIGDLDGADRVARYVSRVEDELARVPAYYVDHAQESLALAWAKKGNASRAVAAAEKIEHLGGRACALARTAELLYSSGVTKTEVRTIAAKAATTAPTWTDTRAGFEYALECIASSLLAIQEVDLALQVTRAVTVDSTRDAMLVPIAVDFAKRGEYRRAKALLEEIRDRSRQEPATNAILLAAFKQP